MSKSKKGIKYIKRDGSILNFIRIRGHKGKKGKKRRNPVKNKIHPTLHHSNDPNY